MLLGACIAVATSGQVEGGLVCGLTFELTGILWRAAVGRE